MTSLPLAVGFGLSTRQHMLSLAPYADGAVVGSAVVRLVAKHQDEPDLAARLGAYCAELKSGLVVGRGGG